MCKVCFECVLPIIINYVDVDSVDVVRLLMVDPQVHTWSVGVTWTSKMGHKLHNKLERFVFGYVLKKYFCEYMFL